MCSTPFGVIVGFTGGDGAHRFRTSSAQRLSASSSGSHAAHDHLGRHQRVLNAFRRHRRVHRRRSRRSRPSGGPVLNAFRRHRRVHPGHGFMLAVYCGGAQRLSASSSGSRAPGRRSPPSTTCAQRLSASSSGSLDDGDPLRRRPLRVLNAFRRHRRVHRRDVGHHRPRHRVLNAFRRHRRVHHGAEVAARDRLRCSTPFGVIVGFTVGPDDHDLPEFAVLNAFRRHRRVHVPGVQVEPLAGQVLNAFRRHRRVHAAVGAVGPGLGSAQRLSASSSGSRNDPDSEAYVREVLNAFRRHRRVHTRTDPPARPAPARAQRLSASSSGSQQGLDGGGCQRLVLNAFRRHRRVHTSGAKGKSLTTHCAQRLSASSSGSPTSPPTNRICWTRAQRLSASSSGSRREGRRHPDGRSVLNAFRRHRRVHSMTPCGAATTPACCSTPFGVIVGFTPATNVREEALTECSTPFGVIVGFTRPAGRR